MCERCYHSSKGLGEDELTTYKDIDFYLYLCQKLISYVEQEDQEFQDGENIPYFRQENIHKVFAALNLNLDEHLGKMEKFCFLKRKTTDPAGWYLYPQGHPKIKENMLTTRQLRTIAQKLHQNCRIRENAQTKERWEYSLAEEIKNSILEMGLRPKLVMGQLVDKHYLVPMNTLPFKEPHAYIIFKTQKEGENYCRVQGRF